ncbi:hypothetical protein BC834DRAFT_635166 [Gloeopeniophorella convolvens]|nr:hypothetical protein BC834DRAFT_635166 [Gloeopeniophorella convolvens]
MFRCGPESKYMDGHRRAATTALKQHLLESRGVVACKHASSPAATQGHPGPTVVTNDVGACTWRGADIDPKFGGGACVGIPPPLLSPPSVPLSARGRIVSKDDVRRRASHRPHTSRRVLRGVSPTADVATPSGAYSRSLVALGCSLRRATSDAVLSGVGEAYGHYFPPSPRCMDLTAVRSQYGATLPGMRHATDCLHRPSAWGTAARPEGRCRRLILGRSVSAEHGVRCEPGPTVRPSFCIRAPWRPDRGMSLELGCQSRRHQRVGDTGSHYHRSCLSSGGKNNNNDAIICCACQILLTPAMYDCTTQAKVFLLQAALPKR